VRGDLVVGGAAEQRLAVLAPEGEEGGEQRSGFRLPSALSQVGLICGSDACGP
jgi:hypothetical protein